MRSASFSRTRTREAWASVLQTLQGGKRATRSSTGGAGRRTEREEQAEVFRWAREQERRIPELAYLFGTFNAGKRRGRGIGMAVSTGLKPGVPDVVLPIPNARAVGLAIEMKVTGNHPTDDQTRWLEALESFGWEVHVCYSAREAIGAIEEFAMHRGFGRRVV